MSVAWGVCAPPASERLCCDDAADPIPLSSVARGRARASPIGRPAARRALAGRTGDRVRRAVRAGRGSPHGRAYLLRRRRRQRRGAAHSDQALRPRGEDGGRYDAYTRWKLEWRYLYREQRDGCRRTSFRTHLTTTIHLPRWQALPDAAPDLRQRWEAYVAALDRHERHHEALAIEAADALERRVGAIDRAADCKTLEAEVNAAGEAVIEDYRARQRAYDVETGHGRSEGVRFP
ncbi:MAG: DUF922 domain-containing Zn-dependent protease [Dokdonella sp.]|nr:DUF922 domain-containing Zn-dependent protease [Dokdonella sp.]